LTFFSPVAILATVYAPQPVYRECTTRAACLFRRVRFALLPAAVALVLGAPRTAAAAIIEGTICDSATHEPIPRVTIRVEHEDRVMFSNEDGYYRLRLDPGTHRLRFTHIAYFPAACDVALSDSTSSRDILLASCLIDVPGTRVYSRAYDPAQEIIVEAIRHKEELLARIRDYRFEGYTKLAVRRLTDDGPAEYFAIIESQLEGWFRQPDRYKEIITARRQSANIPAEVNIITIGEIFNFNANRIDLGQPVVSPTASDALDYYNYYLLDTVLVDGAPAFLLEVEPRTDAHALFAGRILIVDSVYAVAGVDLGLNKGFDSPYLKDLRFTQRMSRFDNDIWMPVEIRFDGDFQSPLPLIPDLRFAYTGLLNRLVINQGIPEERFDRYVLEVAPEADDLDSAAWEQGALLPLTESEQTGYRYLDSLKHRPLTPRRALGYGVMLAAAGTMAQSAHKFFHFNRVEGPYLGAGANLTKLVPRSELSLKTGRAFDADCWQHHYRLQVLLHEPTQLKAAIGYRDEIVARPNIYGDQALNPTFANLFFKYDPIDYYLEKGFDLGLSLRILPHTSATLGYRDFRQSTVGNTTEYSLTGIDRAYRSNPVIADGRLRALSAGLAYDSRPLVRFKGREQQVMAYPYTSVRLEFEAADPDLIATDFHFRRYALSLVRVQSLAGWGFTSLRAYAGGSDYALPPQRFFTVSLENPYEPFLEFKTLSDFNVTGDRVAAFYLEHDFGGTLFRRLGLPLLEELPFGLAVYGGSFWTDIRAATRASFPAAFAGAPDPPKSAPDWYSEIGFGISRLPLLVELLFTWRVSAHESDRFSFKFNMSF